MPWTNYHTHCHVCDGEGEPQQYIEAAIQQGVSALGFSSHAPVPFPTSWTLQQADLDGYCQLIRRLKDEYANPLPVYLGLEIDFIPNLTSPKAAIFEAAGLDFSIGAVHYAGQDDDGAWWTVDGPLEQFSKGLAETYGGNVQHMVEYFYEHVREMVQMACPDVVAHFDLIKKHNWQSKYFSEDAPWYRAAVFDTLDAIAKSGAILEVNTGGLTRKRTDALYPSTWILERCYALNIPVTLSADAHEPAHVIDGFDDAAKVLLDVGYREMSVLGSTGWQPTRFTEAGLLR